MKIIEIDSVAGMEERIRPLLLRPEWVGYHGTSSAYSERIETEGFRIDKPLPREDIAFVAELSSRFPQTSTHSVGVRGFLELGTTSFTSAPLVALKYLTPGRLGGQGVGFVLEAAVALLSFGQGRLSSADKERLDGIVSQINEIRSQQRVIYAVNLQGLTRINYDKTTAGIYAHQWIPPNRILAKAVVSDRLVIDPGSGLTDGVRKARAVAGSWLSMLPEARPNPRGWDIVERKKGSELTPWSITAENADTGRFLQVTSAAFEPTEWAMLDNYEKVTAEERFFRELCVAYERITVQQSLLDAERFVTACFNTFLGREPGASVIDISFARHDLPKALQKLLK